MTLANGRKKGMFLLNSALHQYIFDISVYHGLVEGQDQEDDNDDEWEDIDDDDMFRYNLDVFCLFLRLYIPLLFRLSQLQNNIFLVMEMEKTVDQNTRIW